MHCLKDCTYKERSDGKCPHCRKAFALEPRSGDRLTDMVIDASIKAVSSSGTVRWNLDNLYYEICRRKHSQMVGCGSLGCGLPTFLIGFGLSMVLFEGWMEVVGLAGSMGLGALVYRSSPPPSLFPKATFNQQWSKWATVNGVPDTMIVAQTPKRPLVESDLGDYSFDRAVICDRNSTVDLLIANRFHFENNCAVLTASGYPSHLFEVVKKMLNRNPRLKVWVLHDATPEGCSLAYKLKNDPNWFPQGATIIDVGMRPGNCKGLEKVWIRGDFSVAETPALTQDERVWLQHNQLELAAIRPEQVIKRLYRSMTTYETQGDSGGSAVFIDSTSFSSDASSSDGGGDSFG